MKRLLIAAAALAASVGGLPAAAHAQYQYGGGHDQSDDDWNNGGNTYDEFQAEYQHVVQVIRHGMSDGTISRYQAQRYYRELQSIGRAAYYAQRYGDYEGGEVQQRLERLHDRVDARHERAHERQDRYYDPHYR